MMKLAWPTYGRAPCSLNAEIMIILYYRTKIKLGFSKDDFATLMSISGTRNWCQIRHLNIQSENCRWCTSIRHHSQGRKVSPSCATLICISVKYAKYFVMPNRPMRARTYRSARLNGHWNFPGSGNFKPPRFVEANLYQSTCPRARRDGKQMGKL